MTSDAQFALRRIIEKYSSAARFCLICNYVSKIIPALQSRCTRFRFAPLAKEQIRGRLLEVATAEKVTTTPSGVEAILDLSLGDMRRVMNLLQSTSMSYPTVDEKNVYLTSGAPLPAHVDVIARSLFNDNFKIASECLLDYIRNHGYALSDIITELSNFVCAGTFPDAVLGCLLEGLSDVEYQCAVGCSDEMQSRAVAGVFGRAKGMMS